MPPSWSLMNARIGPDWFGSSGYGNRASGTWGRFGSLLRSSAKPLPLEP
jgi:hypothetical protein